MADQEKEPKLWYVVNTYAGHENRVKENLERRIKTMGMEDNLFRIVVAEEEEIDFKNGKQIKTKEDIKEMIRLAKESDLVVMKTKKRMYEACGKLYVGGLGVSRTEVEAVK